MTFFNKNAPFYNLAFFYLLLGFILRVILLFHPITQSAFGILDLMKIFFFGFLSDFFIVIIAAVFLWLYLIFISDFKYSKPTGYIIFGLLLALLAYVSFGNTILTEYGGGAPTIGIAFVAIKTIAFGLLLFLPEYRHKIRFWLFCFTIFLYVVLMLQNTISEFFFWNEFGVRYNFIAVDYLVYTNEVIGNIMQSYPVIPIFGGLFLVSAIITFVIVRQSRGYLENLPVLREKLRISAVYLGLFAVSLVAIPLLSSR